MTEQVRNDDNLPFPRSSSERPASELVVPGHILHAERSQEVLMEFKGPYLLAMREQAPKMFNRLRRTGAKDSHLQEKSEEAHRLFDYLTENSPKEKNGLPEQPYLREAEDQVFAALIEFPSEGPEPSDPLGGSNR